MAVAGSSSVVEEPSTPPSPFYCPISLDIMTDPVTVSSGITYDRASIQGWIAAGNDTCPVTRQPLSVHGPLLIPNRTLLQIIQAWCNSHSHTTSGHLVEDRQLGGVRAGYTRIGRLCVDALLKLSLIDRHDSPFILPHAKASSLLSSLLAHHSIASCQNHSLSLQTCQEAISTLSFLPPSPHLLSPLYHSHVLQCLLHFLPNDSSFHAAFLLANLISLHPSPKPFLRSLPVHTLSSIARGLSLVLKLHSPPRALVENILRSLSLICKSSRTVLISLTEATLTGMARVALDQLLLSSRQGSGSAPSPILDNALSLLENVAACAEGRAAIASQAFAVPTIAKHLQRSASGAAMESAVVTLWKLCRYSSEERVRRQAMVCCVPSKLVLLLQASQCSGRTRAKAGSLVKLLLEEAKSRH